MRLLIAAAVFTIDAKHNNCAGHGKYWVNIIILLFIPPTTFQMHNQNIRPKLSRPTTGHYKHRGRQEYAVSKKEQQEKQICYRGHDWLID